jgi:SSS family solute:Na+ symporter
MTYAATTYSAFMLVGLVGLTYKSGIGALGFEMTYLVFTVLLLLVFAPRFWLVARRFGEITPPELLGHRYESRLVAVVAAAISFVMLIPYCSVQLMGVGFLVQGLSRGEVPYLAGVLLMAVLSGFCALWAGMRSISWTDAFQALTMLATSLAALMFIFYRFFGSPESFFVELAASRPELLRFTWDFELFIGLSLPWAFFALTNPQASQRMFIPASKASLRRMILFFAWFGLIYTVVSVLFGLQAGMLLSGLNNPDQAMPRLLTKVPVPIALIIFLGIFSAATSTLGSIILTLGSMLSRDIAKQLRPDLSGAAETHIGRISTLALLSACIGFAWLQPGMIAVLASMASGGLLVMAPAIIGAFFWKRATAAAAIVSMLLGGVLTGFLSLAGVYPLGWWPSVWGLGLTAACFLLVSLATSPPSRGAEFIDNLERELISSGFRYSRTSSGYPR